MTAMKCTRPAVQAGDKRSEMRVVTLVGDDYVSDPSLTGNGHWMEYECGARWPLISVPKRRINGSHQHVCPDCGELATHRVVPCQTCGLWVRRSTRSGTALRCKMCAKVDTMASVDVMKNRWIVGQIDDAERYLVALFGRWWWNRTGAEHVIEAADSRPPRVRANDCHAPRKVPPREDCRHYLADCLPKAAFKNMAYVKCDGCERYEPHELGAEMFVRVKDSFTKTCFPQG